MSNSRDPTDCSLPGSSVWDFPSKNTGVGAISFSIHITDLTAAWNLGGFSKGKGAGAVLERWARRGALGAEGSAGRGGERWTRRGALWQEHSSVTVCSREDVARPAESRVLAA